MKLCEAKYWLCHENNDPDTELEMNETFAFLNSSLCSSYLFPHVTLLTKSFLSLVLFITIITNAFLLIILRSFSTLKTPPNNYLLNISINNVTLCICMIVSIVYVPTVSSLGCLKILPLYKLQLFVSSNSFLQYWGTFVSIGYYRYWTLKQQCLSQKIKMRLIIQSVLACWVVSTSLSGLLIWTFADEEHLDSILQFSPHKSGATVEFIFTKDQSMVMSLYLLVLFSGFVLIVLSYYQTFKALNSVKLLQKCKVMPFNKVDSQMTNLMGPGQQQVNSVNFHNKYIFMVSTPEIYSSSSPTQESPIVHYNLGGENSLMTDGIFALENPIKATCLEKPSGRRLNQEGSPSRTELENRIPRFTDISNESNIKMIQTQKWRQAMRRQSFWHDDRLSLRLTIRHSFLMLLVFLLLSLPFLLCKLPGFLTHTFSHYYDRLLMTIISQFIFYINGPIYPIYYFVFCKRIRKCLLTLIHRAFVQLKIRK